MLVRTCSSISSTIGKVPASTLVEELFFSFQFGLLILLLSGQSFQSLFLSFLLLSFGLPLPKVSGFAGGSTGTAISKPGMAESSSIGGSSDVRVAKPSWVSLGFLRLRNEVRLLQAYRSWGSVTSGALLSLRGGITDSLYARASHSRPLERPEETICLVAARILAIYVAACVKGLCGARQGRRVQAGSGGRVRKPLAKRKALEAKLHPPWSTS